MCNAPSNHIDKTLNVYGWVNWVLNTVPVNTSTAQLVTLSVSRWVSEWVNDFWFHLFQCQQLQRQGPRQRETETHTLSWESDLVTHSVCWQIEKLKPCPWGFVTDTQWVTWTAFAILAMFFLIHPNFQLQHDKTFSANNELFYIVYFLLSCEMYF